MTKPLIAEPASPSKLTLIREFLRLEGTQERIDSGVFMNRFAFFSPVLRPYAVRSVFGALRKAYEGHAPKFQEAYEYHLNW